MPGGASSPLLGSAAFLAIKFAGYSAAGKVISKAYDRTDLNSLVVGGARTGIGLVFGALAVIGLSMLGPRAGSPLFLLALLPVRLVEWWLLVALFYDRRAARSRLGWKVVILGTVWSFVLDIPTIAGLIVVGGFWIC